MNPEDFFLLFFSLKGMGLFSGRVHLHSSLCPYHEEQVGRSVSDVCKALWPLILLKM